MSVHDMGLGKKKAALWRRFVALGDAVVPSVPDMPRRVEDALALGYRMGLQAGYGEGLLDGVALGLDVSKQAPRGFAWPVAFPSTFITPLDEVC